MNESPFFPLCVWCVYVCTSRSHQRCWALRYRLSRFVCGRDYWKVFLVLIQALRSDVWVYMMVSTTVWMCLHVCARVYSQCELPNVKFFCLSLFLCLKSVQTQWPLTNWPQGHAALHCLCTVCETLVFSPLIGHSLTHTHIHTHTHTHTHTRAHMLYDHSVTLADTIGRPSTFLSPGGIKDAARSMA